ncbi:methylamine utilization protein [Noviherbaspirillum pedocola]|nr:methylamine utilization protein [Noviherbaspirillum pedocola]
MMRGTAARMALLFVLAGSAKAATVDALVLDPKGQPVPDAAVVLYPLAPAAHKPRLPATIEQRGSEFIPYVTVVQTGTAVEFPNNDSIKHHAYSFSAAKRFEIKLYAGKPGQPVIFDKPGEVVIGCNIHDWMEAHVLVVDSPYFARTAPNGSAAIANVPAGRYRLQLWHPQQKAGQAPSEVDIGPSPARITMKLDVKPRERKPRAETDPDRY